MTVNKVIYGDQTIIDISDSTVTDGDLRDGIVAYDRSGKKVIGNYSNSLSITDFDANVTFITDSDDDYLLTLKEKVVVGCDAISNGWRLNATDGLCSQNNAYRLVKYKVVSGDSLWVHSDDRFQFQNSVSVPDSGASNKIGSVYSTGDFQLTVPNGATYLIISTLIYGGEAYVYKEKTT